MPPKKKSCRPCVACGEKKVIEKKDRCLDCYKVWIADEIGKDPTFPR